MNEWKEAQNMKERVRSTMQVMQREDEATVFCFEDKEGKIRSTVYTPFSGVSLVWKEVHRPQFISNWRYGPVPAFGIEYCLEGRLECQVGDECLYLSPGSISLSCTDPKHRILQYPGGYYHAVSIVFRTDEPHAMWKEYLAKSGVTVEELLHSYIPEGSYFTILKSTDLLLRLLDGIKGAPDSVKNAYYGAKSLECLALLAAGMLETEEKPPKKIAKHQAEMVKEVYQYVMRHPEERYSIEDLARKFVVSPTHLKQCFQIVYGTSMQKFIREQKLKAAARVLETTDHKVTEVAQMFGYSNISKFADAFQRVMGEYPKQYSLRFSGVSDLGSLDQEKECEAKCV